MHLGFRFSTLRVVWRGHSLNVFLLPPAIFTMCVLERVVRTMRWLHPIAQPPSLAVHCRHFQLAAFFLFLSKGHHKEGCFIILGRCDL